MFVILPRCAQVRRVVFATEGEMDYRWKGAMLQRIRDCARRGPWIEIAVAYAVALQMILVDRAGG
jgi:hypothetical protein